MAESRVKKSLLNVRVNLIFYVLTLTLTFFSRKIFLNYLGADFIGLIGTLQNILGFLNLAELGIGSAVSFALYKPLQRGCKEEISEIVSLFGFFYRRVGQFVLLAAVVLSFFLPLIFKDSGVKLSVVYFSYFSLLVSNLIGYFINYRSLLLSADQKNYVVASYLQSCNVIKTVLQLVLAYVYGNVYLWVAIDLIFGILYSFILNWKIDREYTWLVTDIQAGRCLNSKYPEIMKRSKQVIVHRLKNFLLSNSDQILIFSFVSLSMVAYYGNYTMIISRVTGMFTSTLESMWAGVGNLVAEGNKNKILNVFWEMIAICYYIAGVVCFCVISFIDDFIVLWLGEEYVLNHIILYMLVAVSWIGTTRGAVDMYSSTHGLYADTWSAWTEAGINMTVSISLAMVYGLPGLLIGKLVSLVPIIVLWKPYYLFTKGLKVSYLLYWRKLIVYIAFVVAPGAILYFLLSVLKAEYGVICTSWAKFLFVATIFSLAYCLTSAVLLAISTSGGRSLFMRVKPLFIKLTPSLK